MAVPDPGVSAQAAMRPCTVRRWLIATGQAAVLGDYGMFPYRGQNIDTPRGVLVKWTSDDDNHPIP